jgi:3-oxoacyl-(acyl-carrier-protein) synthase
VEMLVAQRALSEGIVPPTVNLKEVDDDARGWVSDQPQNVRGRALALMTNAGFSGINTALVLG